MATDIIKKPTSVEEEESSTEGEVGQWYWTKYKGQTFLGCVVRRGSNYVKVEGIDYSIRVHHDSFWEKCTFEPDPKAHIDAQIQHHKTNVQNLLAKVQEVTERLSLGDQAPGDQTKALATINTPVDAHKKALIKAKEDILPKLFGQIEDENRLLSKWMTAMLIPLRAKSGSLRSLQNEIEDKVFHVELYAGLTEEVAVVKKGKPADKGEKLHLLQRRHYMDEECLLDYQAGGMDFQSIKAFDAWLRKKRNFERIFPFPRCMVAFQVRREKKDYAWDYDMRGGGSLWQFIQFHEFNEKTYLYIRNGKQLFRLGTSVEFGEKLFPDLERSRLEGTLWVKRPDYHVIDQNRYDGLGEDYKKADKEYRRQKAAYEKAKKEFEPDAEYEKLLKRYRESYNDSAAGRKRAKERALEDSLGLKEPWPVPLNEQKGYVQLNQGYLFYDDAMEALQAKVKEHNRIALLLQGLFDRSTVLHPHPKVKLWTPEGFDEAVKLVFDVDRAIDPGEKPDFEAYRKRLNASLKTGSVTVGQEKVWLRQEAERENERQARNWRIRHASNYKFFRPYGNPGPGLVAQVAKFRPRKRQCVYRWKRERMVYDPWRDDKIPAVLVVDEDQVLNLDAYTPGDYKQFFADHRTRAEYLRWAPLLLVAEDYHAGKIEVRSEEEDG